MSALTKAYIAIALLLALAGSHWYAYSVGGTNGSNVVKVEAQVKTIAEKQSEIDALDKTNKENAAIIDGFSASTKKANQDHEKELADVRATGVRNASKRVRIDPNIFCSKVGAGTEGSQTGSDGQDVAEALFLPEPFASELQQIAIDADGIAADLRHLVRRTDEAGCFQ